MTGLRERPNRQAPDIIITLGAAGSGSERREVTRQGRMFMCMSVSVEGVVNIGLDQEPVEMMYTQVGNVLDPAEGVFNKIYLENTHNASVTVHLKTTMGNVIDNRLVLVGGSISAEIVNDLSDPVPVEVVNPETYPDTITTAAGAAVAAADHLDIAANAARRMLIIYNDHASNVVWWCEQSNTGSQGVPIGPKQALQVAFVGASRVRNNSGASVGVYVTELA